MDKIQLIFVSLLLIFVVGCKESSTVLSAVKDGDELEEGSRVLFLLKQNYPNPFNPSTTINYGVLITMQLTMNVYTEDWRKVSTLFDNIRSPGYYEVEFLALNDDGEALPSGDYYYTLEGSGYILTRKMKLLK